MFVYSKVRYPCLSHDMLDSNVTELGLPFNTINTAVGPHYIFQHHDNCPPLVSISRCSLHPQTSMLACCGLDTGSKSVDDEIPKPSGGLWL